MKTVQVDLGHDWRGGQNQALLLMEGLRALGHGVELVAAEGGALASKARAAGFVVHAVPGGCLRLAAACKLRSVDAEVVHCHDAHGLTAAWLGGVHRRARLVASRRVAYPLSRGLFGAARYRSAHRVVAVSGFVKDAVVAGGIDPSRVVVVYDGVPSPERCSPEERDACRRMWTGEPGEPLLGYMGHLSAEKGHELLMRAFALLKGRAARSRLVLAGEGPERARLERLARDLGVAPRTRFAGHVDEVATVYRALDAFVFPSRNEGLGSALLTAMAHALPVVAAAGGASSEIVEDGADGLLAQPPDAEGIAAAVERILDDPALAARLGEAARATVEARFTASRMVEGTLAAYAGR